MLRWLDRGIAVRRTPKKARDVLVSLGIAAMLAVGTTASAFAQNSSDQTAKPSNQTSKHKAANQKEKSVPHRTGPLFAVVSIADQRVSFYGAEGLVERSPISSGQPGHRTPTGVFAILGKELFHRSNLYSDAPMPYMQRITWSGVAMHTGVLPGYPASHGCIRLPDSFARHIFGMTKVGQRVIISPSDIVPLEITHANLPSPKIWEIPEETQTNAGAQSTGQGTNDSQGQTQGVGKETMLTVEPRVKRLNPLEYLAVMRTEAAAKKKAAAQALKAAQQLVSAKQEAARETIKGAKAAEAVVANIERQIAAATSKIERMYGDAGSVEKAVEIRGAAEAKRAEAKKTLDEARLLKANKEQELRDAWQAASKAETENKEADAKAADARAATIEDEIRAARKTIKSAESAFKYAEEQVGKADTKVMHAQEEKAHGDSLAAQAIAARSALEAKLVDAKNALNEINKAKGAKEQEIADARKAVDAAESASEMAAATIRETSRRTEPLSVFISRKTSRLYVRQGFKSVFDVGVTIKEPDRPIGTHVYVSTEVLDGTRLRWSAVSMPAEAEPKPRSREKTRHSASNGDPMVTASVILPAESATGALDRIEIPADAVARLSELTWLGASLIVSDHAMSGETNESTDFVILTHRHSN
jgi:lipoprotein-anchoring transpeptidase ErfK/SrfK